MPACFTGHVYQKSAHPRLDCNSQLIPRGSVRGLGCPNGLLSLRKGAGGRSRQAKQLQYSKGLHTRCHSSTPRDADFRENGAAADAWTAERDAYTQLENEYGQQPGTRAQDFTGTNHNGYGEQWGDPTATNAPASNEWMVTENSDSPKFDTSPKGIWSAGQTPDAALGNGPDRDTWTGARIPDEALQVSSGDFGGRSGSLRMEDALDQDMSALNLDSGILERHREEDTALQMQPRVDQSGRGHERQTREAQTPPGVWKGKSRGAAQQPGGGEKPINPPRLRCCPLEESNLESLREHMYYMLEIADAYGNAHWEMFKSHSLIGNFLQFGVIIFTTVGGTSSLVNINSTGDNMLLYISPAATYIATILAGFQSYAKPSGSAAKHLLAAKRYQRLERNIRDVIYFSHPNEYSRMIKQFQEQMNVFQEQSPGVDIEPEKRDRRRLTAHQARMAALLALPD